MELKSLVMILIKLSKLFKQVGNNINKNKLNHRLFSSSFFILLKFLNLLLIERDVIKQKTYSTSYPSKIDLNTTNICNYRCKFCEIHYFYKFSKEKAGRVFPNDIKPAFIKKFNKAFNRVLTVELSGASGEPLMNPHLLKICKLLKQKQVALSMTTNGSLLRQLTVNNLLDMGFDNILVSIHSGDPKQYNQLQGGDLDGIFRNLKYIIELKSKKKLKFPLIKVNCMVFTLNKDTIFPLIKKLDNIGIKSIHIYHYYDARNMINEKVSFYFYPQKGNDFLQFLYKNTEKLKINLTPHPPEYILPIKKDSSSMGNEIQCKNPWKVLKFKGCVEFKNSYYITVCNRILLFRLNYEEFEGQFIRDLWNHELIRYLRKTVLKNPICKFCKDSYTKELRCINNQEYQIKRDKAIEKFFQEFYSKIKVKDRKGIYLLNKNPYAYRDYYERKK